MKNFQTKFLIIVFCTGLFGCSESLDEEIFSELSPATLFSTEEGLNSLLNSAYAHIHRTGRVEQWAPYHTGTFTAGEVWGAGGSIEAIWRPLINFTWDGNHEHLNLMWNMYFNAIRDANLVLDNLRNEAISDAFRQSAEAQTHFIRGFAYAELYKLYGRLPIYQSSTDDPLLPRSTDEETMAFVEQELLAAIAGLPEEAEQFGRGSKIVARAILAKWYLNTKQWQNAAEMSEMVIDAGVYRLLPNYSDVFDLENEGNDEIIWGLPKISSSTTAAMELNALIFPPNFPLPFPNNGVFAARTYLFDAFVNSFEDTDTRTSQIITEYTATDSGELVQGLGNDQSFPFKFPWDPAAVGSRAGNDILVIRYSDMLLTRAEALNELNGPTQEAMDLINEVRVRASASLLTLGDFTQDSLREAILKEREFEFYFEGNAREDQIRHGVFISRAQARGANAQDFHVLFPLPQVDLDANSNLDQNPGY